ncbi:molybdate ABC transporter permease subunit [Cohnella luojiensis]|uniref:Molybdenum transport system permease n=1 Tax=Cohnella luojiensis TaxID=652876 RepID=A0A4Y8LPW3_9BACL|nr:molybdate ABC transporter permease subunit [Cohnella luojiensis]TFE19649.1 molybdate ABC transporter permease subunit [Cohnella luojiensis]
MTDWKSFIAPIYLSAQVAIISSIIVFVLAVAVAKWMARRRFVGKTALETLFMLPLVLPPSVVGFILLVMLGRRSYIGQAYEWFVGQPVVFSWVAAVIAAVVVAFPLAYRTIKTGFEEVDGELEDSARALGASDWQVFRFITAPLASRSLIAGFILGFARALGEFGATLMIAGNIPHRTQTIPTAIYVAVDGGNLSLAWMWAFTMVLLSFLMLLAANRYPR